MKFIHSLPDILDRKRFFLLLFSRIRYAHRTACVQGWIDRILDGGTSAFFSILVAGSTSREIGYQPTRHPNGLSSPLDGEETATQFPSALFIRPRKRKVSGRESGRAESFTIRNHSVPRASSIWGWRWIMHPSPPRDEHPPFYSPAIESPTFNCISLRNRPYSQRS